MRRTPLAITSALDALERAGLRRTRRTVSATFAEDATPALSRVGDRDVVDFCSNDYLGLARHPDVAAAFVRAAQTYGVGAGASHLVSGHGRAHDELEHALAAFTGRERALLFSTGYMANLGVIGALADRRTHVVQDRLNHASLIDAARFAGAKLIRYRHADTEDAARRLAASGDDDALLVTDGVFSMDGDVAPLVELARAAKARDAWLIVDDAHGLGVIGPTGRGSVEAAALSADDVPVLIGTLGKAFGTFGAFVAGDAELIEYLLQRARTYIYTTALPPAVAAATLESVRLIDREKWRRERLHTLIARFRAAATRENVPLMPSSSPIQPVPIGDDRLAVRVGERLFEQGFWVGAIRPPTVPVGSARLRVTICAAHADEQIDRLVELLAAALHAEKLSS